MMVNLLHQRECLISIALSRMAMIIKTELWHNQIQIELELCLASRRTVHYWFQTNKHKVPTCNSMGGNVGQFWHNSQLLAQFAFNPVYIGELDPSVDKLASDILFAWTCTWLVLFINKVTVFALELFTHVTEHVHVHVSFSNTFEQVLDCFHTTAKCVIWIWIRNAHFELKFERR